VSCFSVANPTVELQRQRCKISNATSSLARFENKNIFYHENAQAYYAGVVAVNSKSQDWLLGREMYAIIEVKLVSGFCGYFSE
jgi:hypothetical protein